MIVAEWRRIDDGAASTSSNVSFGFSSTPFFVVENLLRTCLSVNWL